MSKNQCAQTKSTQTRDSLSSDLSAKLQPFSKGLRKPYVNPTKVFSIEIFYRSGTHAYFSNNQPFNIDIIHPIITIRYFCNLVLIYL